MTSATDVNNPLTCRRALEGLRNGVPNEAAVKILGCHQPQAESRFQELLAGLMPPDRPPSGAVGMLVAGDFGTGKSHLLSYLEHQALVQGFVCSKLTISKETPFYNLDKVFKSAVAHGRMPDRTGQLMEELGLRLKDSPEYARFVHWTNSGQNGLHGIFPATLVVHERITGDDAEERMSDIRSFWAGERIKVSTVKDGLRQIGQLPNYPFKAPKAKELPSQRLRFATELIKGAGYKGWVILLDELELVGSYTLPQRARSYAELARWLGQVADEACPGLVVVGTVTSDFTAAVLDDAGKQDRHKAAQWLRSHGEEAVAARAETGMRILERETTSLTSPTDEDVNATIGKLRGIYSLAYGWDAPQKEGRAGGAGFQGRMRYKVRSAINEWDLLRLYPNARPETEGTEFSARYEEVPELEQETKGDESESR